MAVFIVGILVLIAGFIVKRSPELFRYSKILQIAGVVIMITAVLIKSIVQIEAGQIGVKVLFGKVQNEVLGSGLHFINPFIEIRSLDVKTQNYTMSGMTDEGQKKDDDAIRVLTADGLEVTIDLTVLYKLLPSEAPKLVRETGVDYTDKIVRPLTRTKIRDNAVYYDAVSLYSTKRDEFQSRIFKSIDEDFKIRGLILEQLLVRNITLPQSVKATIEQKINAEQDAQKMEFVLQKEKQEAERKRVEAQGIADYQRIINIGLTNQQLQYEQIKAYLELAKSQNAKVIIMGKGDAPVILDTKN
ncbi:prohibitin family protein [Terrimonas pollutisoli]|uniref:prohibitin family protein n=1 Tax=Terrimonas pollutisoli TaxID=3034147 RepID=UPI0023EB1CF3|nr:prohibitin family protein [Terrimonas sp. H1YJ31]